MAVVAPTSSLLSDLKLQRVLKDPFLTVSKMSRFLLATASCLAILSCKCAGFVLKNNKSDLWEPKAVVGKNTIALEREDCRPVKNWTR